MKSFFVFYLQWTLFIKSWRIATVNPKGQLQRASSYQCEVNTWLCMYSTFCGSLTFSWSCCLHCTLLFKLKSSSLSRYSLPSRWIALVLCSLKHGLNILLMVYAANYSHTALFSCCFIIIAYMYIYHNASIGFR